MDYTDDIDNVDLDNNFDDRDDLLVDTAETSQVDETSFTDTSSIHRNDSD